MYNELSWTFAQNDDGRNEETNDGKKAKTKKEKQNRKKERKKHKRTQSERKEKKWFLLYFPFAQIFVLNRESWAYTFESEGKNKQFFCCAEATKTTRPTNQSKFSCMSLNSITTLLSTENYNQNAKDNWAKIQSVCCVAFASASIRNCTCTGFFVSLERLSWCLLLLCCCGCSCSSSNVISGGKTVLKAARAYFDWSFSVLLDKTPAKRNRWVGHPQSADTRPDRPYRPKYDILRIITGDFTR